MKPGSDPSVAALRPGTTAATLQRATLLPHEWFFGAFLLVHGLRLVWVAGPLDPDAVRYLLLLGANAAVIAWCGRQETNVRWQLRLWFHPVAMNVVFFSMNSAVLKVAPHTWDAGLRAIDESLFGTLLSVHAQGIASPLLTEILSGCYLLFFPYLLFSWIAYARRGLELLRPLFVGLFTIYGLGFLGYSLVPAAGPHLAWPEQFTAPLTGWAITACNAHVVAAGSNGVDVFPSLHCAVAVFLLDFDRRHAPGRFWLLLVPGAGLCLATVYLRYHYFIDIVAGFALAAFGGGIARRWAGTHSPALRQTLSP